MSSDRARNTALRDIFALGAASTLSVLQADFGHWPPTGLIPVSTPDVPVDFKTFFHPNSAYHGVVLHERPSTIYVNKILLLPHLFNRVSTGLGETLAHENIHVLQNAFLNHNGLVPLAEHYGDFLNALSGPDMRENAASLRELQTDLHSIVSDHYRRTGLIPLNTAELWALLRTERVFPKSAYVDDLLDSSMEGHWAKKRFPAASARPRKDLLIDVANLNVLFLFMKKERRDEFCAEILPAAYGRLLEIYGDRFGSMRMGYNHNLRLSENFVHQCRNFEHAETADKPAHIAAMEKTIALMPLSQIGCLQHELPRHNGWKHKSTAASIPLKSETIDFICELLYRHTKPVIAKPLQMP